MPINGSAILREKEVHYKRSSNLHMVYSDFLPNTNEFEESDIKITVLNKNLKKSETLKENCKNGAEKPSNKSV